MMRREARWLARQIYRRPAQEIFPIVDLGSSTVHYRKVMQPHIDECIYRPARDLGFHVIPVDPRADEANAIAGDVFSAQVNELIKRLRPGTVICASMLEHVPDPAAAAAMLTDLLPAGASLFVTVPRRFEYHPDPIDNLFRPTLRQLRELFAGLEFVRGAVVGGGLQYQHRAEGVAALHAPLLKLVTGGRMYPDAQALLPLLAPVAATCGWFRRR